MCVCARFILPAGVPTPKGTIYSPALKMAWDTFDCKENLVTWSWVTNGCDGNKGFIFEVGMAVGEATQLVSGLTLPGAQRPQCVTTNGNTVGTPLKLTSCPAADADSDTRGDPGWDFGERDLLWRPMIITLDMLRS
jgi:hypothetical protein